MAKLANESHPFEEIVDHCLTKTSPHTNISCLTLSFIIPDVYDNI